ncbi:uncharacterized protein AB675_2537 [Cyphellophora attinorum]|uniref:Uncharacterized protein n=1 Tax=Cyphellophora attinorum TaxID=1664694 RepID=A0A0N1HXK9_9EURO|nr:uncharacterized protein AB675_2537 [Phialophora attinorum]KPI45314.1 hypothetical protein AB675_2537 [Phialophora attinorum]
MASFHSPAKDEESDDLEDLISDTEANHNDYDLSPEKHTTDLNDFPSVSVLSDRTKAQSEPLSPGRNRKRSSDEAYRRSQPPSFSIPSTTPRHPPPTVSFLSQISSEGRKPSQNLFGTREGSSKLQSVMTPDSPPQSLVPTLDSSAESEPEAVEMETRTPTFAEAIASVQTTLDADFDAYAKDLEERDSTGDLEDLDWNQLEERYMNELRPLTQAEESVHAEIGDRMKQYLLWTQVSSEKESERAFKRLRTRSAFVQNSEQNLAKKQQHCAQRLRDRHVPAPSMITQIALAFFEAGIFMRDILDEFLDVLTSSI